MLASIKVRPSLNGPAQQRSHRSKCGMDSAANYLDDYPGGIEAAVRDNAMPGGAGQSIPC
jgi:hypothetical protein